MKTSVHPSGLVINFDEDKHRYVDDNGQVYTGVTKVIHSLFPQFDAERIAGFVARKRGCLREEVLAEWEEKRNASTDFGDKIHSYAESLLTKQKFIDESDDNIKSYKEKEIPYMKQVKKIIPKLLKHYELIGAEKIVFSPSYAVSGTIDILMRNKRTKQLSIFDWKTNEEIRDKNKHHPSQTGLYFLNHIPDSNFYHYALQANVYRMLLITEKYYPETDYELAIFHIREDSIVPYKLPLLENEAEQLLKKAKELKKHEDTLHDND